MKVTVHSSIISGVTAKKVTITCSNESTLEKSARLEHLQAVNKLSGFQLDHPLTSIQFSPPYSQNPTPLHDLAIDVGILALQGHVSIVQLERFLFIGELSPTGELIPAKGILPVAIQARSDNFKGLIVPKANAREAAIVNDIEVYGLETLKDVVDFLTRKKNLSPTFVETRDEFSANQATHPLNFADITGFHRAKRALEIAAAGKHNLLLIGSPDVGKKMLAKRLPTILPPLTLHQSLELTKLHSVAGTLPHNSTLIAHPPFRAPHYSNSLESLLGNSAGLLPGEVSLAHHGILYLDNLSEWEPSKLEAIYKVLQEKQNTLSNNASSKIYPTYPLLVASVSPCPCGNYLEPNRGCGCEKETIMEYRRKLSSSLLDSFDIHIEVTSESIKEEGYGSSKRNSEEIKERVIRAINTQVERFKDYDSINSNAELPDSLVQSFCQVNTASLNFLKKSIKSKNINSISIEKLLSISKTISDLSDKNTAQIEHLAQTIGLRTSSF